MSSFRLETPAHTETKRLMRRLARLQERWPSEPTLHVLSPQAIDGVLDYIARREKERHCLELATLLFVGWAAVFSLCMRWYAMAAIVVTGECLFFWIVLMAAGRYRYAVYALTQTNDVRVLEALTLATRYKWGRHPEILNSINRLLEQVTEADAGLLSDRAQQRLWTIGIAWQTHSDAYDPQMAIRVLRALASVGNRATYMRFRRFAYRSEHFIGERYAIATARELLPVMEVRYQRQQVPETLLRASSSAAHPETLLRAAHTSTPEPSAQLLRATSEHSQTDV